MKKILDNVKGDKVIWSVIVILSLFSLLLIYSTTDRLAMQYNSSTFKYMVSQAFYLCLGLLVIYIFHRMKYTTFMKWSVYLYLASIPLLIYTLFFGTELNSGSRWIAIPFVGLTIQTSDLAKLAIFTFLARQLSLKQKIVNDFWKGFFFPILMPVLIICGLIAPANLSTALLLGVTCCILFFIGRVPIKYILLLAVAGVLLMLTIFGVSKLTGKGRGATWQKRVEVFFDNTKADADDTYQTDQANIAVANGGLTGRGPGNSYAKNYLPHPYSDFVFAIVIEEYGLIGASLVIFCYLLLLWRSINIFRRCPYAFGAFLSLGLSFTLVFQAFINMAVAVHLVPVTGQTLPFISKGGSSIVFTAVAIGIILSVSRYVDAMEGKQQLVKQVQKEQEEALANEA
ncbi:MAG: cell division protein FtsW [Bacteroidetes bacterium 43-16]|nr:MAG: cell division protein FtsW [Bacteroidetes bacterium 43-16]